MRACVLITRKKEWNFFFLLWSHAIGHCPVCSHPSLCANVLFVLFRHQALIDGIAVVIFIIVIVSPFGRHCYCDKFHVVA